MGKNAVQVEHNNVLWNEKQIGGEDVHDARTAAGANENDAVCGTAAVAPKPKADAASEAARSCRLR